LNAVVAATAPPASTTPGCEYTLSLADLQSTNTGVTRQRVLAGGVEIFPGSDGYYHVPLTDSAYHVIVDTNDPTTLTASISPATRAMTSTQ
jgi:hypothetical protein